MTLQNGTPMDKNHIKTYDGISKHMTTQNRTPVCKNYIKKHQDTKLYTRVQEIHTKMGPQIITICKPMTI